MGITQQQIVSLLENVLFESASQAAANAAIADTALTVSGGDVTFGRSTAPFLPGSSVTSLDLSGDTDTAGTNYVTVGSDDVSIILAHDDTVIDVNRHAGTSITADAVHTYDASAPAPNLTITGASAELDIYLASTPTGLTVNWHIIDNSMILSALLFELAASHRPGEIEFGDDGSSTHIVESSDGTASADALTIIKIAGAETSKRRPRCALNQHYWS